MAKGSPCDGTGRRVVNIYLKDRAPCSVCGKEVRVVNYRPKIGGRYGEHI